jgi:hypothetical protein
MILLLSPNSSYGEQLARRGRGEIPMISGDHR